MNSGNPQLISPKTKIRDLLRVNEDLVIDSLVTLNKNFSKLHNPMLKKLFAGRVTIADACRVGGVSVDSFLQCMRNIGFVTEQDNVPQIEEPVSAGSAGIRKDDALALDVRPILAGGKDPLKVILQEVGKLADGQSLKLINSFEPLPLYHVLAEKGFSHYTENPAADIFIIWFQKTGVRPAQRTIEPEASMRVDFDKRLTSYPETKLVHIDVRALEMPKPMLMILEKIGELDDDHALLVNHKKVPVYLLPQLKEKGYEYLIKSLVNGDVQILIYKV